jgi:hypothetical protein
MASWLRFRRRVKRSSNIHSNCSCSTCGKILDFLRKSVHQMPLGKARILLDGDCPHVDFSKSLEYLYRPLPDTDYLNTLMYISGDSDHVRFKAEWKLPGELTPSTIPAVSAHMLVFRESVPHHVGNALILDQQRIDPGVFQGWISMCDETHGSKCRSMPLLVPEDNVMPRYLIDTRDNCIVKGSRRPLWR